MIRSKSFERKFKNSGFGWRRKAAGKPLSADLCQPSPGKVTPRIPASTARSDMQIDIKRCIGISSFCPANIAGGCDRPSKSAPRPRAVNARL